MISCRQPWSSAWTSNLERSPLWSKDLQSSITLQLWCRDGVLRCCIGFLCEGEGICGITDMIAKQEKEAEKDVAAKAYCDEEMIKTKPRRVSLMMKLPNL